MARKERGPVGPEITRGAREVVKVVEFSTGSGGLGGIAIAPRESRPKGWIRHPRGARRNPFSGQKEK
jgi:hypothetical protein